MSLPVDFEKLVKLPDSNGYPYSIKAADLMKNFAWCDLLPSASTDALRAELVEEPGSTAQHRQRRIVLSGGSSGPSGSMHPFRVSRSATDDGSGTIWDVMGGTVAGNGGSVTVASSLVTLESASGGEIWLKITRDASSRAITTATIEHGYSAPYPSTSSDQYRLIAIISAGTAVQYTFDADVLQELLISENGEFKLATLKMAAKNTYSPPSPT